MVNEREQFLANKYYTIIRDDLNSRGICPARGMIICIKILAIMTRNMEPKNRSQAEQQVHHVLEHEFSMNPSE